MPEFTKSKEQDLSHISINILKEIEKDLNDEKDSPNDTRFSSLDNTIHNPL